MALTICLPLHNYVSFDQQWFLDKEYYIIIELKKNTVEII